MSRPPARTTAIALVLVLAGCGSHAVTKQDFIARADAICASAIRGERNVAASAGGGAVSLRALARYLGAVVPIVNSEVAQLRKLPQPGADRGLLGQYLVAAQAAAGDYASLASSARAGERTAVNLKSAALQSSPAASLAARYGLTTCAGATATVTP